MIVIASTYSWQSVQEGMRSAESVMNRAYEFGLDGMEVMHFGSESMG